MTNPEAMLEKVWSRLTGPAATPALASIYGEVLYVEYEGAGDSLAALRAVATADGRSFQLALRTGAAGESPEISLLWQDGEVSVGAPGDEGWRPLADDGSEGRLTWLLPLMLIREAGDGPGEPKFMQSGPDVNAEAVFALEDRGGRPWRIRMDWESALPSSVSSVASGGNGEDGGVDHVRFLDYRVAHGRAVPEILEAALSFEGRQVRLWLELTETETYESLSQAGLEEAKPGNLWEERPVNEEPEPWIRRLENSLRPSAAKGKDGGGT